MSLPDREFDPDDNFENSTFQGNAFDNSVGNDFDAEDAAPEALVWQLLLLINPGDEDFALQQFDAYRDAAASAGDGDDIEPVWLLKEVIDWRAGFYVDWKDTASLVDSVNELTARWNLRIDWGVDDTVDDDVLDGIDVPSLMATAYDRLREYGYTLWTWNTADEAHAGWITRSSDDEAMRIIAPELGIELRPGNEAF